VRQAVAHVVRPHRLAEQVDEARGDGDDVRGQLLVERHQGLGGHAQPHGLRTGPHEAGVGDAHAVVVHALEHPGAEQRLPPVVVHRDAQPPGQLGGGHLQRGLGRPRREHVEVLRERLLRGLVRGGGHEPFDGRQREALLLELRDEVEPREVLGAVVAGAPLQVRRGEQSARRVGAHVADRHARPAREHVDRHRAPRVHEIPG
jgi:hypothetical protein